MKNYFFQSQLNYTVSFVEVPLGTKNVYSFISHFKLFRLLLKIKIDKLRFGKILLMGKNFNLLFKYFRKIFHLIQRINKI